MYNANEIHICTEFSTGLNAAPKNSHFPLPSTEDILAKLNDRNCFSKIDLSDVYSGIPVEKERLKLLCINTHHGLYKFERLPFGLKVVSAIFQHVKYTMLNGLDFLVTYFKTF